MKIQKKSNIYVTRDLKVFKSLSSFAIISKVADHKIRAIFLYIQKIENIYIYLIQSNTLRTKIQLHHLL